MDGRLQPEEIPFPWNHDRNGIGWVAQLAADGSVSSLAYYHQGVKQGPHLDFYGPHDANYHSGDDLSIRHKHGMSEQFSKFDDSSHPYPEEWREWLAEGLKDLLRYKPPQ
ncbi:MAG: hypothetical protein KF760_34660 [Candidatus Eremiobacteraeota bacterium]|nr:hypothetical protein [Candidatus Eremiobacteraeota bacterium]MCW5868407.1 hypothetical protein [Candidatus Eremiobacteraeota bacterium]